MKKLNSNNAKLIFANCVVHYSHFLIKKELILKNKISATLNVIMNLIFEISNLIIYFNNKFILLA